MDEDVPQPSLASLPELVLHHICTFLSSPFDLLNLGSTCRALRDVTSSPGLWIALALDWFGGVWPWLENGNDTTTDAYSWMIKEMKRQTTEANKTHTHCRPGNEEEWFRSESKKFRCLLGMLRLSYAAKDEHPHPAILYRRWLYDLGLYSRHNPSIPFHCNHIPLSQQTLLEMAALGQAAQRDLRRRKRRHQDLSPLYYVRRVLVSEDGSLEPLFPKNPNGCLCPLLVCPSEAGFTDELSGLGGITTCTSLALTKLLRPKCLKGELSLDQLAPFIKKACQALVNALLDVRLGSRSILETVVSALENKPFWAEKWQEELNNLEVKLHWHDVIEECAAILLHYKHLDAVVDGVRERWRHSLMPDICRMLSLCEEGDPRSVTRLNLTDCDMFGGDNRRQEMAAAAFVGPRGVLVTWQLVGQYDF